MLDVGGGWFITRLRGDDAEAAGLVEIPLGFLTVAEGDFAADKGAGPRDLIHRQGNAAGFGGVGGFFFFDGFFSVGRGRFFSLWRFGIFGSELEVIDEQPGFHVGEAEAEFLAEAVLDFGKFCTLDDPGGDALPLFFGQIHLGYFSISFSGFKLKCKAFFARRRTASLHRLRGSFNVIVMSFGTRLLLIFALGIALGGCTQSDQDEEKEPHYVLGQSRINAMDYQGAVEAFEESLEVNPHSAAAHYQLAMLYENQQSDPAAAIYHYQQYLKFDPSAENADIIRQHIAGCKQQLASDVLTLPTGTAAQQQLEKLVDQNRQLQTQVDSLQAALKQWSDWYAKYTNQMAAQTVPVVLQNNVVQQPVNTGQTQPPGGTQQIVETHPPNPLPHSHTYVVERGETAMAICRKFGIRLNQLESDNPTMNPTRIRPGEVLNIP